MAKLNFDFFVGQKFKSPLFNPAFILRGRSYGPVCPSLNHSVSHSGVQSGFFLLSFGLKLDNAVFKELIVFFAQPFFYFSFCSSFFMFIFYSELSDCLDLIVYLFGFHK